MTTAWLIQIAEGSRVQQIPKPDIGKIIILASVGLTILFVLLIILWRQ